MATLVIIENSLIITLLGDYSHRSFPISLLCTCCPGRTLWVNRRLHLAHGSCWLSAHPSQNTEMLFPFAPGTVEDYVLEQLQDVGDIGALQPLESHIYPVTPLGHPSLIPPAVSKSGAKCVDHVAAIVVSGLCSENLLALHGAVCAVPLETVTLLRAWCPVLGCRCCWSIYSWCPGSTWRGHRHP